MFWNKKDGKGLPDLPPLNTSSVPELKSDVPENMENTENAEDEEEVTKHNLPSFPDSPISKGFSQAAIKDAVTTGDEEEKETGELSKSFKTVEMEEWTPSRPNLPVPKQAPEEMQMPVRMPRQEEPVFDKTGRKNQDLFVKIDKFHSARRALEEAEAKLESIDELLKKIRETKLREEQELSAWEKEIASIKARIQDVTENIFEKME